MAGGGVKSAVFLAVLGNGFLTVIKFIAFFLTGSGAMMSEAAAGDPLDVDLLATEFGDRILEALGDEVDRIEAELAEKFPELAAIDIEAD